MTWCSDTCITVLDGAGPWWAAYIVALPLTYYTAWWLEKKYGAGEHNTADPATQTPEKEACDDQYTPLV